jgi:hypothetical protein
MIWLMSTSLKVVRMAAVRWASTSVAAIRLRILLIGTRLSPWASNGIVFSSPTGASDLLPGAGVAG